MPKKKQPWWEAEQQRPRKRHWEDEQLRAEVAAALAALPPEHPARAAFTADAPTPEISHLLSDQDVLEHQILAQVLKAFDAWRTRAIAAGSATHFSPWRR